MGRVGGLSRSWGVCDPAILLVVQPVAEQPVAKLVRNPSWPPETTGSDSSNIRESLSTVWGETARSSLGPPTDQPQRLSRIPQARRRPAAVAP